MALEENGTSHVFITTTTKHKNKNKNNSYQLKRAGGSSLTRDPGASPEEEVLQVGSGHRQRGQSAVRHAGAVAQVQVAQRRQERGGGGAPDGQVHAGDGSAT